ncbi:MAG: oligosaccharide flippase family protein [Prevotellaceae bacterium]|nr:oligosaccharide flippase family protein [Candidatus Minthosoma equi]
MTENRKRLLESVFSLTALNALNLLLPLITIPYLLDTVGAANYGIYSIVYTVVQYVLLVGKYGFHYTSTKQISQNRDDVLMVSKIFHSTMLARFILTMIASIICLGFIWFVYPKYILLYLLGLGIAFGDVLNPVWLFQGMEKMRYMTIVNSITKILFTVLIFSCISQESDYVYIILFNSAGFIVSGIISFLIAVFIFHIKAQKVSFNDVVVQIKDSSTVFFSSAFVNVFNNSYVLILGLFLNESLIGVYSAVDKVIKAAKILVDPISNALFPHVAKNFMGKPMKDNVNTIFKYSKTIGLLLAAIAVVLVFSSPIVCEKFLHSIKDESMMLIWWMSPLIVIGGLNYVFGIVGLINLGYQKVWLRNLILSSVLGVGVLVATVGKFGLTAAPVSSIITEGMLMLITVMSLLKIKKQI